MKIKLKNTFKIAEIIRKYRGVLLSPKALIIPASKLYPITKNKPDNKKNVKSYASFQISLGTFIKDNILFKKQRQKTVIATLRRKDITKL